MAAGIEEYSWRYWRLEDCEGKSLILDFYSDALWLAYHQAPNDMDSLSAPNLKSSLYSNGGEILLALFINGTLHDGSTIRPQKSNLCYSIYGIPKSEIYDLDLENSQRYGIYQDVCTFWQNPARPFDQANLFEAFEQLENNSVIVCSDIISGYGECECVDPGDFNSLEIKNTCTNQSHFIKLDAFHHIGGYNPESYYSITCNGKTYPYIVVGYSTHEVESNFCSVLDPGLTNVHEITADEAEALCSPKYEFVRCEKDIHIVTANISFDQQGEDSHITIDDLESDMYFTLSDGVDTSCYRYVGRINSAEINRDAVTIIAGPFDDCDCEPAPKNGKFTSCNGEYEIVIDVPYMLRSSFAIGSYYQLNDMFVISIDGVLMKNCFRFDGFVSDDTTESVIISKISECDNTDCTAYMLTDLYSCFSDYTERVYVTLDTLNYLTSIDCESFTYENHRCVYFNKEGEYVNEPPLGARVITISDISDPKEDCFECKSDAIEDGSATCLVIEPCNTDICNLYISLQGLEQSDIDKLIEQYSGNYISFMYMGDEICGKVINDCSSITDGLDPNRVIEPVNITGCYHSCESCYSDGEIPEPPKDDVKLGRKVEPNYEPNESYNSVCYDNCCCNTDEDMKELEECRRQNALLEERIAILEQQLGECKELYNFVLREVVCNAPDIRTAMNDVRNLASSVASNRRLLNDESPIDDMYIISAVSEYYSGQETVGVQRLNDVRIAGGCEPFIY